MIEFDRDECFVTNYEDRFTYDLLIFFGKNDRVILILASL